MKGRQKGNKLKMPQRAMAFYIELYCRRKNSSKRKHHTNLIEATESWLSLSESEKQQFHLKFNQYEEKYTKHLCDQLKNADLFMKEKNTGLEHLTSNQLNNEGHEDHRSGTEAEQGQQTETSDAECDDTNSRVSSAHSSQQIDIQNYQEEHNGNVADTICIDPLSPTMNDIQKHQEETSGNISEERDNNHHQSVQTVLIEPLPPTIKTGHELFNMLSSTDETLDTSTWASLPQIEKRRYSRAVSLLKKDYILKYKEYLESLSSKELFDFYNKTVF